MVMFNTSCSNQNSTVEIEELVNRIRNTEADAARYRWLRNRGFDFSGFEDLKGKDLDREIDGKRQPWSDSDSEIFGFFLGVPANEVGEFIALLREIERDAYLYQYIRN
jgi:hypothetical protein